MVAYDKYIENIKKANRALRRALRAADERLGRWFFNILSRTRCSRKR